jgi:uncharacterized membrane protein YccC
MSFRELISDNKTGRLSSARFISVIAGITLSLATLWLAIISFWETEVIPALTVALGSIAGLAASNYGFQKFTEKKDA